LLIHYAEEDVELIKAGIFTMVLADGVDPYLAISEDGL
jgi:hypothetical protein